MHLLIRGGRLVTPGEVIESDLACDNGVITAIGRDLPADGAEVMDAAGLTVGPGFIDVHVHGGGGYSFFGPDPEVVRAYARWAPRNGVTSFLVSTIGRDAQGTEAIFAGLRASIGRQHGGAEALGFHLEGPFISEVRKGAFHPRMLRAPDPAEFARHQRAAEGAIRQVTLAPELPGALDLIREVTASGAMAALGHTDATVEEMRAGFGAGASHVTHLFNAMRPIHQREGGPIVGALMSPPATCELICDGAHVDFEVARMAAAILGPERLVVVTDNLEMAGSGRTTGEFGRQKVVVEGDKAVREDGTIVGSVATYDRHFRNAVRELGLSLPDAFRACSLNPARVAGVAGRKGSIEVGKDADLVLLDNGLQVVGTVCGGAVVRR